MLQKIKNLTKEVGAQSIGITLALVVFMGLSIALGWTEPAVPPPGGNVGAPLNTSGTGQSKAGGLILNTGGAANGLIVQRGNVGIGMTNPIASLNITTPKLTKLHSDIPSDGVLIAPAVANSTTWVLLSNQPSDFANHDLASFCVAGKDGQCGNEYKAGDSGLGSKKFKDIMFSTRTGVDYVSPTRMTIKNNGNVGIGTTSPSAGLKLDVEGNVGAAAYCDQNGQNCRRGDGELKYCKITAAVPSFTVVNNSWASMLPVPASWTRDACKKFAFENAGDSGKWPNQQWAYDIGCMFADGSISTKKSGAINTSPSPPGDTIGVPSPNCGW